MSHHELLTELCGNIYKVNRIMLDHCRRLMDNEGLGDIPINAAALLFPLLSKEGLTQSQLGKIIHLKSPTMTVIVNRLEELGLVRRERDAQDRRNMHLLLTDEGRAAARRINKIAGRLFQDISPGLKQDSLTATNETLVLVLSNIEDRLS